MRYNLLGNGGHWFPGLNAGKLAEVETRLSEKIAGYAYRDKAIAILKEMHELVGGEAVKRLSESD